MACVLLLSLYGMRSFLVRFAVIETRRCPNMPPVFTLCLNTLPLQTLWRLFALLAAHRHLSALLSGGRVAAPPALGCTDRASDRRRNPVALALTSARILRFSTVPACRHRGVVVPGTHVLPSLKRYGGCSWARIGSRA